MPGTKIFHQKPQSPQSSSLAACADIKRGALAGGKNGALMKKRWRGIGSHLKCAAPSFLPFFLRHVSNPRFVGVSHPHGSDTVCISSCRLGGEEKAKHHKVTQAAEPERSRRRFVPMICPFLPPPLSPHLNTGHAFQRDLSLPSSKGDHSNIGACQTILPLMVEPGIALA